MMKAFYLLLLGLLAGFASAALGIGGGVVIVPALLIFFKFKIKTAIGTSLATIAPAAFVGVLTHYYIENGNIVFWVAVYVMAGAVIGAKFGTVIAHRISGRLLTVLFSLLLLFVGLKLTGILPLPVEAVDGKGIAYPLLVVLGFLAGVGSALFGIGGGVIMVPALNLVFGMSIHQAIATSLMVIVPTTLAGSHFHKKFKNIDMGAVKLLVPAALVGAVLGAVFANAMSSDTLKMMFGVFMLMASIKLILEKDGT